MTPLRTVVVAIGVGVPVGLLTMYAYERVSHEGLGPKLRRECVSLVDTVLKEAPTVKTAELVAELKSRGMSVEPRPDLPSIPANDAQWIVKIEAHDAATKAWDAKWEELRGTRAYDEAWDVVFAKKRENAIRECVYARAQREGVTSR